MREHHILLLAGFLILSSVLELGYCAVEGEDRVVTATLFEHGWFMGRTKKVNFTTCHNLDDFAHLTSSVRTSECVILYSDRCCQGVSFRLEGCSTTVPFYFNDRLVSLRPCRPDSVNSRPSIVTISDGDVDFSFSKFYDNGEVAMYSVGGILTEEVLNSPIKFAREMWSHVKKTYGYFGAEGQLSVFRHADQSIFVRPRTYLTDQCRNQISFPGTPENETMTSEERFLMARDLARIVETASRGINGSPSRQIWRSDRWDHWSEIFAYDVYSSLGLEQEKKWLLESIDTGRQEYEVQWNTREANMFQDFFLPIYTKFGGSSVLSRYFQLLAAYFPKEHNGVEYRKDKMLNWGEFVHFWSGTAGQDLEQLALTAFNSTSNLKEELELAKIQFPHVKYERYEK